MKSKRKVNKGFSLVEVVVALAILTIVATSVLAGFVQSSRINMKSLYLQDATEIAQAVAENFNKRSFNEIRNEMNGYAATDSNVVITDIYDITDPEQARNGLKGMTMENLQLNYIFPAGSEYVMDGPKFTIDVTLDSANYANGKKTTTYQQGDMKKTTATGTSVVASNSFLVPMIKETTNHCVISSADYSDAAAIDELINEWKVTYATAKSAGLPDGPRAIAYAAAENEFATTKKNELFPSGAILASGGGITRPVVTRKLVADVTYKTPPIAASNRYMVEVVLKGEYSFGAVTVNGVSLSAKNITRELVRKDFTYTGGDPDTLQDIYLYVNPIQITEMSATYLKADQNKVKVNYNYTIDSSKVMKNTFYVVMQQVSNSAGNYVLPIYSGAALALEAGSGSPTVYTNMQWLDGTAYKLVSLNSGYLTDGGVNDVTLYDMVITVKYNGQEYARFTTTKED